LTEICYEHSFIIEKSEEQFYEALKMEAEAKNAQSKR